MRAGVVFGVRGSVFLTLLLARPAARFCDVVFILCIPGRLRHIVVWYTPSASSLRYIVLGYTPSASSLRYIVLGYTPSASSLRYMVLVYTRCTSSRSFAGSVRAVPFSAAVRTPLAFLFL